MIALRILLLVCLLQPFAIAQAPAPSPAARTPDIQTPVDYTVIVSEPERRVLDVEVRFAGLTAAPLDVHMSRTSPGRYAAHEFAKNVFDVRVTNGKDQPLVAERPNLHRWTVSGHDGTVVMRYKVYGDRADGTYLGVDTTHAHLNMPATLMWAKGLEMRPARIRFQPPAGKAWRVATQLFPTDDPLRFTAPNLPYLMDSPTEVSAHTLRTFSIATGGANPPLFRIALHHDGSDADADALARDVEKIVRETMPIFGEFPHYDTGTYTFLADYLPWASGDGMEHRNSTVLSSTGALRDAGERLDILGTIAHEFFHGWNMERIRSRAIEPFDLDEVTPSGELWFGEGFTSYYDPLILQRAQLVPLAETLATYAESIATVINSAGRTIRSAEEMSRLAPFVDAAVSIDRTAWPNTFISYYTWGASIGLALDLSLRERSNGQVTLDDYMRAMWQKHGKPGQQVPGLVSTTYTMADLQARLGEVSGSPEFAAEFFAKYIQGHDVPDYARLLARAGLVLQPRTATASLNVLPLSFGDGSGPRATRPVPFGSPLDRAGVAQDDQLLALDGAPLPTQQALNGILGKHKPGDRVPLRFVRRSGEIVDTTVTLDADHRLDLVPAETLGRPLTAEQKTFRERWLGSKASAAAKVAAGW